MSHPIPIETGLLDFDAATLEKPSSIVALTPIESALLAPEDSGADHLRALARVSRLLRSAEICEKLRATHKADALYALITEPVASRAA